MYVNTLNSGNLTWERVIQLENNNILHGRFAKAHHTNEKQHLKRTKHFHWIFCRRILCLTGCHCYQISILWTLTPCIDDTGVPFTYIHTLRKKGGMKIENIVRVIAKLPYLVVKSTTESRVTFFERLECS